MKSSR